jgi:hypothetical protein
MAKREQYEAMTLIERLFKAGLIEKFDAAARQRNRAKMVRLLTQVEVEDPVWSVDTILQNPGRYGF